jgi:hypothetical protein
MEHVERVDQHVIDRRLNFLDARSVVASHDDRGVGQVSPNDFAAVVPKQRDRDHAALPCFLERRGVNTGTVVQGNGRSVSCQRARSPNKSYKRSPSASA